MFFSPDDFLHTSLILGQDRYFFLMSQGRESIVQGPVGQTLFDLTLPMIAGILGLIAFNLVDTYFIGQLGKDQLAAVSFTFPVVLTVASLAMGIGIGVMSLVSKSIGEENYPKAARETTDSMMLGLLLVGFFSTVGLLTIDPLFRALGASEDVLPYIREYIQIWYITILFLIIPMIGNNAIRATGDTKTPSYIMLGAVAINAVLDPLLIFGYGPFPELGIEGAALATAISRMITMVVAVFVLYYREKLLTFNRVPWTSFLACARAILYIGLPAAAARMINPIGMGILTSLIAAYGADAVAAYGVGTRIEMFALSVMSALASVIGPFVGQNLGARKYDRIQVGFNISYRFSLFWGLGMAGVVALVARPLAGLFTPDAQVADNIALFLYIVPVTYTMQGIFLFVTTSLNAMQKPLHAAALAFFQMFLIAVPLALLATRTVGLWGIFVSIGMAYTLTGIAAYVVNQRMLKKVTIERRQVDRLISGVEVAE